MINRRVLLAGLASLGACATDRSSAADVLAAARAARGGARLDAARELAWTGRAVVHAGGRDVEIAVETLVRPFRFARSKTWLVSRPEPARTLIVEDGQAWSETPAGRTALPPAQAANERQQFALYGYMLYRFGEGARVIAEMRDGAPMLRVDSRVGPPQAVLVFDRSYRLLRIETSVADPEDPEQLIAETLEFSDWAMSSAGVDWPKSIRIRQNGAPFFDLSIATFYLRV